jgi:chromosomal replication initiation ATPase DnaA
MPENYELLIEKVCAFFNITKSELFSKDRTYPLPDARHILIIHIMQGKTSQRRTGKLFCATKSIVTHATGKPTHDNEFNKLLKDFNNTL